MFNDRIHEMTSAKPLIHSWASFSVCVRVNQPGCVLYISHLTENTGQGDRYIHQLMGEDCGHLSQPNSWRRAAGGSFQPSVLQTNDDDGGGGGSGGGGEYRVGNFFAGVG